MTTKFDVNSLNVNQISATQNPNGNIFIPPQNVFTNVQANQNLCGHTQSLVINPIIFNGLAVTIRK